MKMLGFYRRLFHFVRDLMLSLLAHRSLDMTFFPSFSRVASRHTLLLFTLYLKILEKYKATTMEFVSKQIREEVCHAM